MTNRLAISQMLQRDGRWPDAVAFKNARIKFYRSEGMTRSDASDAAWFDLEKEYPALHPPQAKLVGPLMETPIPWDGIPEEGDVDDADYWVYQQFALVFEDISESGGEVEVKLNWEKATSPPPSMWAIEGMRRAVQEEKGFFWDFRTWLIATVPLP